MGLDGQCRDTGDMRSSHGRSRLDTTEVSRTDIRRQDRESRGGHVRAHGRVPAARARGAELGKPAAVLVGDVIGVHRDLLAVRSNDGLAVGGPYPEQ